MTDTLEDMEMVLLEMVISITTLVIRQYARLNLVTNLGCLVLLLWTNPIIRS